MTVNRESTISIPLKFAEQKTSDLFSERAESSSTSIGSRRANFAVSAMHEPMRSHILMEQSLKKDFQGKWSLYIFGGVYLYIYMVTCSESCVVFHYSLPGKRCFDVLFINLAFRVNLTCFFGTADGQYVTTTFCSRKRHHDHSNIHNNINSNIIIIIINNNNESSNINIISNKSSSITMASSALTA